MKKLLLALMLAATAAKATTVTGVLRDININLITTRVRFAPVSQVVAFPGYVEVGPSQMIITTNGQFTIELANGTYIVSLPTIPQKNPFQICVPAEGTFNLIDVICNPSVPYAFTNTFFGVKLFAGDLCPDFLGAKLIAGPGTSFIFNTNGGCNTLTISSSGSGVASNIVVRGSQPLAVGTNVPGGDYTILAIPQQLGLGTNNSFITSTNYNEVNYMGTSLAEATNRVPYWQGNKRLGYQYLIPTTNTLFPNESFINYSPKSSGEWVYYMGSDAVGNSDGAWSFRLTASNSTPLRWTYPAIVDGDELSTTISIHTNDMTFRDNAGTFGLGSSTNRIVWSVDKTNAMQFGSRDTTNTINGKSIVLNTLGGIFVSNNVGFYGFGINQLTNVEMISIDDSGDDNLILNRLLGSSSGGTIVEGVGGLTVTNLTGANTRFVHVLPDGRLAAVYATNAFSGGGGASSNTIFQLTAVPPVSDVPQFVGQLGVFAYGSPLYTMYLYRAYGTSAGQWMQDQSYDFSAPAIHGGLGTMPYTAGGPQWKFFVNGHNGNQTNNDISNNSDVVAHFVSGNLWKYSQIDMRGVKTNGLGVYSEDLANWGTIGVGNPLAVSGLAGVFYWGVADINQPMAILATGDWGGVSNDAQHQDNQVWSWDFLHGKTHVRHPVANVSTFTNTANVDAMLFDQVNDLFLVRSNVYSQKFGATNFIGLGVPTAGAATFPWEGTQVYSSTNIAMLIMGNGFYDYTANLAAGQNGAWGFDSAGKFRAGGYVVSGDYPAFAHANNAPFTIARVNKDDLAARGGTLTKEITIDTSGNTFIWGQLTTTNAQLYSAANKMALELFDTTGMNTNQAQGYDISGNVIWQLYNNGDLGIRALFATNNILGGGNLDISNRASIYGSLIAGTNGAIHTTNQVQFATSGNRNAWELVGGGTGSNYVNVPMFTRVSITNDGPFTFTSTGNLWANGQLNLRRTSDGDGWAINGALFPQFGGQNIGLTSSQIGKLMLSGSVTNANAANQPAVALGTATLSVYDNGVRGVISGTETTLTETTATAILTCSLANSKYAGFHIFATTHADDGSDFQSTVDELFVAAVNKGGTVTLGTSTIGTSATATAVSAAGTLTTSWTATASGTTISIKNSATSSLSQTTLKTKWRVEVDTDDTALTISPQ